MKARQSLERARDLNSHVARTRVVLMMAGSLLLLAGAYYLGASTSAGNSRSRSAGGASHSRMQELLGCWQSPGLANQQQGMQVNLTYKHYYVATSTIPGAGLGVFAKHDMPKGFIWNVEDAQPGSSLNFTRTHWESISHLAGRLEAAGVQHHAVFELVSFIRRYSYYCADADLLMVSLTAATLTNHAATPQAGVAITTSRRAQTARFVPNSVGAWPSGAAEASKQAAELGVPAPNHTERCVLARTLRAVKAGEELMEDYARYDCPWPGCNSPTAAAVKV